MLFQLLRFAAFGLVLCFPDGDVLAAEDRSAGRPAEPPLAALRLVVITDDDFLLSAEAGAWCSAALRRAVEELRRLRADTELKVEIRSAGAPAILRGGRMPQGPRRAVGFLCDPEGAVAAFCVGVPTGRQLAAMVEDADEVAVLRLTDALPAKQSQDQEQERPDRLVEALHERARGRVLRHYRPLVHQIDRQTPLALAMARLQPALAADRNERFLFAGVADGPRWLSAQQHTETMHHWCQAMLPCIVTKPVDSVWQELVGLLWGGQPWSLAPQVAELLDWYRESIARGPVILSVKSTQPLLGQGSVAANAAPVERAAGRDQKLAAQTAALLEQAEHRAVGLAEVAHLMHHRQDKPVEMLGGAEPFTGWVIFTGSRAPIVVPVSAERRLVDTVRKLLAVP